MGAGKTQQAAPRIVTRPPVKQDFIVKDLRRQIVTGLLAPGGQLPTRADLEAHYQVSSTTLQRALDRLVRYGFVESQGSKGTFVVDRPPHLSHYGLVFPRQPADPEWRRFWTAMSNEGRRMQDQTSSKVHTYFDLNGWTDVEDYQRLLRDVRAYVLAGVIFASPTTPLIGTPLLDEMRIPCVALSSADMSPGVPKVTTDRRDFILRAMQSMVQAGRRRVALIAAPAQYEEYFRVAAGLGVEIKPYWVQTVVQSHPDAARKVAHLLMHSDQTVRPNGLIIDDDNCVEYATAGLVDAGVRVPDDLHVVAHCNFPWPTPSVLAVKRLGYDARAVFAACVDSIDRQRRGEAVPDVTTVGALFEDEIR